MENSETEATDERNGQLLPLSEARDLLDALYLINALIQSGGNLSRTAEELGIGRRTIYDLMEKHGISCTEGKLSIELRPFLSYVELRSPLLENYFIQDQQ